MHSLAVAQVLGIVTALHVIAAAIWVGGLFFAYTMLRPAAAALGQPVRLGLWLAVLHRFFRWIWIAVITLIVTGNLQTIAIFGNHRFAPLYVHLMHALGFLMALVFVYAWFGPWRQLKRDVGEQQWDDGIVQLDRLRRLVVVNLVLGLTTIAIAASGPFF